MIQGVTRTKSRSPTTQARKWSRAMNWLHHRICSSPTWRRKLESDLLPWALQHVSLGSDLLELGPGFGFTTAFLHARTANLTTVEVHHASAKRLLQCFRGTNVRVVEADAAALPFADCSFSAAACFTMLHHISSMELQDQLFRNVYRVLRPQLYSSELTVLTAG